MMEKTSETTLVVERIIDANAEEIFDALTKESKLRQWFYPIERGYSVEVQFSANEGGDYQINMVDPDGKIYPHKGEIRDLVPNKKLVFTWNSHVVENTLVTIRLEEMGDKTKVILTHEFKPGDEIGGHEDGWKELLGNLNNLLTNL